MPAHDRLPAAPASRSGSEGVRYGGDHEFGVSAGYSGVSGHIFGYRKDVQYSLINLRYSYLMHQGKHYTVRYAPEVTLAARLDEPILTDDEVEIGRQHTYGAGLSFVGFQATILPGHRIQPMLGMNAGALYFADRVLSPQGSQFMYTIDVGPGFNIYTSPRTAVMIGYRYQHLSNANISVHNPGTDANTVYVGFSLFRTHGVR